MTMRMGRGDKVAKLGEQILKMLAICGCDHKISQTWRRVANYPELKQYLDTI